jgi:hypothetical protein
VTASGAAPAVAPAACTSVASFASLSAFDRSRMFAAAISPGGISNSAGSSVAISSSVTSIAATIGLPSSPGVVVA